MSLDRIFNIQALEPFGELWTFKEAPAHKDSALRSIDFGLETQEAFRETVSLVRKAGLIIINGLGPQRDWTQYRGVDVGTIPRLLNWSCAEPIPVRMTQVTEWSPDLNFARNAALHRAGRQHVQTLKADLAEIPREILDEYSIHLLIEAYEQDEPYYSDDFLSPRNRISEAIARRENQLLGSLWIQGQNLEKICTTLEYLRRVQTALLRFKENIGRDTEKYTLKSAQYPNAIALSSQDPNDRFDDRERWTFVWVEPSSKNRSGAIRSDFIFSSSNRRSDTVYQSFSQYKKSQQ